jgi:phytoene/squalene synthetase
MRTLRNCAGEVETTLRRDQDRHPVTSRNAADLRALFAETWEEAEVPAEMMDQFMAAVQFESHWPALAQVVAKPDGTLWVQRVVRLRLVRGQA